MSSAKVRTTVRNGLFSPFLILVLGLVTLSIAPAGEHNQTDKRKISERFIGDLGDNVLLGATSDGHLLISGGWGLDTTPWIDIIAPTQEHGTKLAFVDKSSGKKISPNDGRLDSSRQLLAFTYRWTIGIYDFAKRSGYLLTKLAPSYAESEFLAIPKWITQKRVTALSLKNWRTLYVLNIEKHRRDIAFSSTKYFIEDYDVGPDGSFVLAMGPTGKKLISAEAGKDSFHIDPIRAKWINLYQLSIKPKGLKRLTTGQWVDFSPKSSPSGHYIAFLRGTITQKLRTRNQMEGYVTLSDTDPTLHVFDLTTRKARKVIKTKVVTKEIDFAWRDKQTLSFRRSVKNGSAIYLYNVAKGAHSEFYRTVGTIRSFIWLSKGNKLILIERRYDKVDVLVTIITEG